MYTVTYLHTDNNDSMGSKVGLAKKIEKQKSFELPSPGKNLTAIFVFFGQAGEKITLQ